MPVLGGLEAAGLLAGAGKTPRQGARGDHVQPGRVCPRGAARRGGRIPAQGRSAGPTAARRRVFARSPPSSQPSTGRSRASRSVRVRRAAAVEVTDRVVVRATADQVADPWRTADLVLDTAGVLPISAMEPGMVDPAPPDHVTGPDAGSLMAGLLHSIDGLDGTDSVETVAFLTCLPRHVGISGPTVLPMARAVRPTTEENATAPCVARARVPAHPACSACLPHSSRARPGRWPESAAGRTWRSGTGRPPPAGARCTGAVRGRRRRRSAGPYPDGLLTRGTGRPGIPRGGRGWPTTGRERS
ncbi:hypothetical protein APS67_004701 [Streptomyces sp. AVP053U2]|nr:hypothetical protein APS67_004701 [Streptomyces sp. AVP053U2]